MVEELLKQIEACENKIVYEKYRDKYLEKLVHSYPTLKEPEEKVLFRLYHETKDRVYKDIIFKCHLRDVHDTCKDTSGYREDLISEGIVLLCEFIDHYDYTMPYTTFTKQLITRLTILYNEKSMENNKSLDTKMSTHQLARLEEKGKVLTDTDDINLSDSQYVPKELLVIVPKERLIIVPNKEDYLLNKGSSNKIFREVFKTKKLSYKPIKRIKPSDREY